MPQTALHETYTQRMSESVTKIKSQWTKPIDVCMVLGSGLGQALQVGDLKDSVAIPYNAIPHFHHSTVQGHAGELVFGQHEASGLHLGVMRGRFHLYEGYDPQEVVYPIRVLRQLGAQILIITNAAGGLNPSFTPGSLMVITDHLNLTGMNPLRGKNWDDMGPRFPDMTTTYTDDYQVMALEEGKRLDFNMHQGVYGGVLGPTYETPAEINMLRSLGADAVGMSTVHEVIAARHAGMSILGISLITNLAAGLQKGHTLTHDEVLQTAQSVADRFPLLIDAVLKRMH